MNYTHRIRTSITYSVILIIGLVLPLTFVHASPSAPDLDQFAALFSPLDVNGTIEPIENILVTPTSDSVGLSSEYVIEFDIKQSEFVHLDYGGLGIAFPNGFGFENLTTIEIADDHPIFEHSVRNFYVSDGTIFVNLKCPSCDGDGLTTGRTNDPVHVTLSLSEIANPVVAGEYILAVVAYDKKNRIIAGPDLSAPFSVGEVTQPEPSQIQIYELTSIAPNAPWVNTGQQFQMQAGISNLSDEVINFLEVRLVSNGASIIMDAVRSMSLAPFDSITMYFDITADTLPSVGEQFILEVTDPPGVVYSQVDRIENVIIQNPASLRLTHYLFGVNNGIVPFGGNFSMAVELSNEGQSSVSEAEYQISVDPPLIDDYPLLGTITAGVNQVFEFIAPPFDTVIAITFTLTSVPVDLNTGDPAPLDPSQFEFEVRPQSLDGNLFVQTTLKGNNLITPGAARDILEVGFINRAGSGESVIAIDSLVLLFFDFDGNPIDLTSLFDPFHSGFMNDQVKAECVIQENKIICRFADALIGQLDSLNFSFGILVKAATVEGLVARFDISQIGASYVSGPLQGSHPTLAVDGDFSREFRFVIRGNGLEESVVIERNPVDPNEGPMRFSYFLSVKSDVEFRVFTLTGEEVYALDVPAGTEGAVSDQENILEWDGRNNNGQMVLNGVYLAHIYVAATGESTSLKVAVLK